VRWYGLLIALGVVLGAVWAVREARRRGLDPEALLDMTPWLALGGLVGARVVFVATSPGAVFGPGSSPLDALAIWKGGLSIHGAVVGAVVATWLYARVKGLHMWSYLDVMTPAGALGIIGGRLGNLMNGSDTTGRLTGLPIGFTWPEPGTETFGAFGRLVFGEGMWRGYPGTCSLGAEIGYLQCAALGGEIVRGPVHFTQLYGAVVGVLLIPVVWWALRRAATAPGFVFWQFVLWYSVLRAIIEEPFRDNPLALRVYVSDGPDSLGIGLVTLTQLASVVLILVAWAMLVRGRRTPAAPAAPDASPGD
jgi:phosphatidylglycerol---prolipoprotein diacylglyceryl transferase